ncbi:CopD family protein [Aliikangiella sp. IMCC44632]
MIEWYIYIKAMHIVFFTSWFAGLFYLPRIFVNLAMVEHPSTYQHLLLMAQKLYRFITPFMWITIFLGAWLLWLYPTWLNMVWLQAKLILVLTLVIYHVQCSRYLNRFANQENAKNHVFFRWFNEFPVLILVAIVVLAVAKPL